jgi:hypothetical protein
MHIAASLKLLSDGFQPVIAGDFSEARGEDRWRLIYCEIKEIDCLGVVNQKGVLGMIWK